MLKIFQRANALRVLVFWDTKWMELFERNFVIKFLSGLNDAYEVVRE